MNVRALLIWLIMAVPALAQGFAGLGTSAEGFAVPQRGTPLVFPRDHGAHPDFRIEWWYLTANLEAADGTDYGIQWTLFRSALVPEERPGWSSPQIWMGHAAITTADNHFVAERLSRGGTGQAGVTLQPFAAWIDDWRMTSTSPAGADLLSQISLRASGLDFSYALTLDAQGPLVLQGDRGYSVKSDQGQASYYYSQPFYRVAGTLHLPGGPVQVTGQAGPGCAEEVAIMLLLGLGIDPVEATRLARADLILPRPQAGSLLARAMAAAQLQSHLPLQPPVRDTKT